MSLAQVVPHHDGYGHKGIRPVKRQTSQTTPRGLQVLESDSELVDRFTDYKYLLKINKLYIYRKILYIVLKI